MKNKVLPIISMIILIAAGGIFLYPTVSVWINQMLSDSAITQYNYTVDTLSQTERSEQLAEAREYNREVSNVFSDSFDADSFMSDERYNSILNVTGDGQIGTVNIPSIDCHLPIFHGNSKETLTKGAVHMAFTSFPIGGESSHSVISAHTAYPGKRCGYQSRLAIGNTVFRGAERKRFGHARYLYAVLGEYTPTLGDGRA